jgi:hypothetical protein
MRMQRFTPKQAYRAMPQLDVIASLRVRSLDGQRQWHRQRSERLGCRASQPAYIFNRLKRVVRISVENFLNLKPCRLDLLKPNGS